MKTFKFNLNDINLGKISGQRIIYCFEKIGISDIDMYDHGFFVAPRVIRNEIIPFKIKLGSGRTSVNESIRKSIKSS